jgi:imidazolonepropionase-like amidohydrolase
VTREVVELTAGLTLSGPKGASERLVKLRDSDRLMLRAGKLIDGTGSAPIANAAVVIEKRRITFAGPASQAPHDPGVEELNFEGKTLLPGLIDAHIHLTGETTADAYRRFLIPPPQVRVLRAAVDAARVLAAGFTTVRDIGMPGPGLALKAAVSEGLVDGPRIFSAIAAIGQTGGHADWHPFPYEWTREGIFPRGTMVDGVDACLKAVRLMVREGADFIKLVLESGGVTNTPQDLRPSPEFSDAELHALIDESHQRGVRVAAHAKSAWVIRRAVEFGVDTIEHGDLDATDTDVFDLMAAKGVILVPTLSLYYMVSTGGGEWGVWEDGRRAAAAFLPRRQAMVRAAVARGVKVAVGTDFFVSAVHGKNAKELELLVGAGLTPMQAIEAATRVGAETLGLEREFGTLELGKMADILVVDGDPLQDVSVLSAPGNPVRVFATGANLAA